MSQHDLIYYDGDQVPVAHESGDRLDLRGCEVYDRNHEKIGIISEIYCSSEDLMAKYVEIVPFVSEEEKNFIYPFDIISWRGDGPIFIGSTLDSLQQFSEYHAEYMLKNNLKSLVTYNEALDLGFHTLWQENNQQCA